MSTFQQPQMPVAAPFNVLNPTGIDPGQALAALIQTGEGNRQRANTSNIAAQRNATDRAVTQMHLDAQVKSDQTNQQFQAGQNDLDRAERARMADRELALRQQDQEDAAFFHKTSEEYAATLDEINSNIEKIHRDKDIAEAQGNADLVAQLQAQLQPLMDRKEKAESALLKIQALKSTRDGLFGRGAQGMDGKHPGVSIVDAMTKAYEGSSAIVKNLDQSITAFLQSKLGVQIPAFSGTGAGEGRTAFQPGSTESGEMVGPPSPDRPRREGFRPRTGSDPAPTPPYDPILNSSLRRADRTTLGSDQNAVLSPMSKYERDLAAQGKVPPPYSIEGNPDWKYNKDDPFEIPELHTGAPVMLPKDKQSDLARALNGEAPDPVQGQRQVWDDLAEVIQTSIGAGGEGVKTKITSFLSELERAANLRGAGRQDAIRAAQASWYALTKSKEEGGMGVDSELLRTALKTLRNQGSSLKAVEAGGKGAIAGQEAAAGQTPTDMSGTNLSGYGQLVAKMVEAARLMPSETNPDRFAFDLDAKDPALTAQQSKEAILDAVRVIADAPDFQNLYERLSNKDPDDDTELNPILATFDPRAKAAIRLAIREHFASLDREIKEANLDEGLFGKAKGSPWAAEDTLRETVRQTDQEISKGQMDKSLKEAANKVNIAKDAAAKEEVERKKGAEARRKKGQAISDYTSKRKRPPILEITGTGRAPKDASRTPSATAPRMAATKGTTSGGPALASKPKPVPMSPEMKKTKQAEQAFIAGDNEEAARLAFEVSEEAGQAMLALIARKQEKSRNLYEQSRKLR